MKTPRPVSLVVDLEVEARLENLIAAKLAIEIAIAKTLVDHAAPIFDEIADARRHLLHIFQE